MMKKFKVVEEWVSTDRGHSTYIVEAETEEKARHIVDTAQVDSCEDAETKNISFDTDILSVEEIHNAND